MSVVTAPPRAGLFSFASMEHNLPMLARATAVLLILAPLAAHGHGGGLDDLGCHYNRRAGGYHCHRGSLDGRSFASKVEAILALRDKLPPHRPSSTVPPARVTTPMIVTGRATIVDGDTLDIGGKRIRLHGIDAPESQQNCQTESLSYRCGRDATTALADKIGQRPVACHRKDVDRYGRLVGVCWIGTEDLNAWMVWQGWAVAYRRFSTDYVLHEDAAKKARRGIWRGQFQMPWDWRSARRNR